MSYEHYEHNNYEESISQEILKNAENLVRSIGETEISLEGANDEYVIRVDISVEKVEVE